MAWIGLGVLLQLALAGAIILALASNRADMWSEVAALGMAIAVLHPIGFPPASTPLVRELPSADIVRGGLFLVIVVLAVAAPKAPFLLGRLPIRNLLSNRAGPLGLYMLDISAGLLLAPVAAVAGILAMSVPLIVVLAVAAPKASRLLGCFSKFLAPVAAVAVILSIIFPFSMITLFALVFPPFLGIGTRYAAFGFGVLWPMFLVVRRSYSFRLSETSVAFAIVTATTLLFWGDLQGQWGGFNGTKDWLSYYVMASFWIGTTASAWWTAEQHQRLISSWTTGAG